MQPGSISSHTYALCSLRDARSECLSEIGAARVWRASYRPRERLHWDRQGLHDHSELPHAHPSCTHSSPCMYSSQSFELRSAATIMTSGFKIKPAANTAQQRQRARRTHARTPRRVAASSPILRNGSRTQLPISASLWKMSKWYLQRRYAYGPLMILFQVLHENSNADSQAHFKGGV